MNAVAIAEELADFIDDSDYLKQKFRYALDKLRPFAGPEAVLAYHRSR